MNTALLAPGVLFAIGFGYLALLFLIAAATDRGLLPRALTSNALVYSLSLGVYATSWTYYGSVGLADRSGYAFLCIYLGVTGAFLLGPRLLAPLLALCREHQLTSIADLLAFRYGGRSSGVIVTLFMLVGTLPYLSLQIQAVSQSLQVLTGETRLEVVAFGFCVLVSAFALLFGARHLSMREKHRGLVTAIAFESAIKLIALLVAGGFVVFELFGSLDALDRFARERPETLESLYQPIDSGLWSTLLLLAFSAAFLLPRQYHMTFVECERPAHLATASWLFPLYLLLLNLPIVPILFGGRLLELDVAPDFYVLGLTLALDRPWLSVLVFLGGLSAASAMMIVTTLALSSMCVNHLLLPASLAGNARGDVYRRILVSRRLVIAALIMAGYAFTVVLDRSDGLASLGLISFVAAAQLLPGTLGLLFWQRGTQRGFVTGLFLGALCWAVLLILPLFVPATDPLSLYAIDTDLWTFATFTSLSLNTLGFVLGSLAWPASASERAVATLTTLRSDAASEFSADLATALPADTPHIARSGIHYRYAMQQALGSRVAHEEFERAMRESGIDERETRAPALGLLHDRLERNLTGLLGPTLARDILNHRRPGSVRDEASSDAGAGAGRDGGLLELRLEASRARMRGVTRQLDDLRRYLRDVLQELPIGVCTVSADGRVQLWNATMEAATGIADGIARGRSVPVLPAPWGDALSRFVRDGDRERRLELQVDGRRRVIDLRRADIAAPIDTNEPETPDAEAHGHVVLLEDRTALAALESELAHSERLASIGRLAAGVAHEIGNPLTGIASLAQNLRAELLSDEDTVPDAVPDSMKDAGASSPHSGASAPSVQDLDEQTGDILAQVDRIDTIVQSLLGFSRAERAAPDGEETMRLDHLVNEAIRLAGFALDTGGVTLAADIPASLHVRGDPNQLVQVFVNLLANAQHASRPGGDVTITARENGAEVRIAVRDRGTGIEPAVRATLFEPFVTTKPVGQGTGLGLSLVYSIVARHGGRVAALDPDDAAGGALFEVHLPRAAALDTPIASSTDGPASALRGERPGSDLA